jgi:GMP synthase-like glutamine amidotransferase
MTEEKAAIRTWVELLGRPYLGVCLGHQLLADALGGEVGLMPEPEIGVRHMTLTAAANSDALFGVLPPVISGLQWHGAQVLRVPEHSVVLATNAACPIQAFRAGPRAWGVQFHMEVGEDTVDEWAAVPEYLRALERRGITEADLRTAVAEELAVMEQATATMAERLTIAVHEANAARAGVDHTS